MNKKALIIIVLLIVGIGIYLKYLRPGTGDYKKSSLSEELNRKIEVNKDNLKCKNCNLIMISLSNVSAKHMSLYGYERLTTPNLDMWSQDALVFRNAFTHASWTLPAVTSLFTSLYPYTHGIKNRYTDNMLSKDIKTFPQILKENGYKTHAFTGGLDYSGKFGHMRGFDNVVEMNNDPVNPAFENNFSIIFEQSKTWIEKYSGEKFFLFIHSYDAHCPFTPPEKFRGKFSKKNRKNTDFDDTLCLRGYKNSNNSDKNITQYYKKMNDVGTVILNRYDVKYLEDLYDEEILSVDELLSDFLNGLDESILDKTIIVIFSDHGEMFAKHGRFGRAGSIRGTLYDEVLHVPLIIKGPNIFNKTADELIQFIDVAPTLLFMLNIKFSGLIQGKNLLPLIRQNKEINNYVFAGSDYYGSQHPVFKQEKTINEMIRNKNWKLIREVRFSDKQEESYELYKISDDPEEINNVVSQRNEVFLEMSRELKKITEESKIIMQNLKMQTKELPQNFINDAQKRGYW